MSSSTGTGWAQLRQQARSLENQVFIEKDPSIINTNQRQTETLFHTYSQFAAAANIPPKPAEDERHTEAKLQELLEKVRSHPALGLK